MSRPYVYILLLMLFMLSGCFKDKQLEELRKWKVTLDREDKKAYGSYLAYKSLQYFFPDAVIHPLSSGFKYTNMSDEMMYNTRGRSLLILQGINFYLSEPEWKNLKEFVSNGNEVVIFCSRLDSKIEQELGCEKELYGEESTDFYAFTTDHNNKNILHIPGEQKKYGYIGRSLKGFFSINNNIDSNSAWSPADTLGYVYDNPDLIRYKSGGGHITLHAAPLVLSNYFLLQPDNEQYLSALWQTLPANIDHIYWSNYYTRSSEASGFDILWRYPATKLALLLGIFALLAYILFEGKRKQRVIPIIAPIKNDSVSFVETVGRLYYNKGDHTNLAEKMVQQFLEWVRMHYLLNTNLLNEHFITQLAIKSGQAEATVRELVYRIHEIRLREAKIDDTYLYQFYNIIQQFYKNHRI